LSENFPENQSFELVLRLFALRLFH